MNDIAAENQYFVIAGMGVTGFSIARFLQKQGKRFVLYDTRERSTFADRFDLAFPNAEKYFGILEQDTILGAQEIYLSPGVSRDEPHIRKAIDSGKSVVGDIELFLRATDKPVIGITGSNGKSTLATLVSIAAEKDQRKVALGGNIGTPALDLLEQDVELFVLELSSFQLESTTKPGLLVGCILNISADHMDRYGSMDCYVRTKQRIYEGAQYCVYNADDLLTLPEKNEYHTAISFGVGVSAEHEERSVVFFPDSGNLMSGDQLLISKNDIKIKGNHNIKNALALFAVAKAAGISTDACKSVLKVFGGLAHRCQIIMTEGAITYIDDSKATNVGAAIAALEGLAPEFSGIVLIAGGDGKGAGFSDLANAIGRHARVLVLIGVAAAEIAKEVDVAVDIHRAADMRNAVDIARREARPGNAVLLSPACASFDMYDNFEARGLEFANCVRNVGSAIHAS